MSEDKTIVVRGKLTWAKIVGKARPHTGNPKYDKGPYWSVDITPDADSLKKIKAAGIEDKLKAPKDGDFRKEKFLPVTHVEKKFDDGSNNQPKITDSQGETWSQNTLIGNGSVADVMLKVKDYGTTVGVYFQKARVLDLVSYEGGSDEFAPLSEDDKFFSQSSKDSAEKSDTPSKAFDEDPDDDIPFD